jgi:hypothetical protein
MPWGRFTVQPTAVPRAIEAASLKRAFLRKGVSRQRRALRTFGDFYTDCGRFGSGDACWTQHGVLAKDFGVDLGDQVVLAIGVTAPNLSELD